MEQKKECDFTMFYKRGLFYNVLQERFVLQCFTRKFCFTMLNLFQSKYRFHEDKSLFYNVLQTKENFQYWLDFFVKQNFVKQQNNHITSKSKLNYFTTFYNE